MEATKTMKADQARLRDLLTQTITLMCRNGLEFSCNLRVEGLLAVTVDGADIFVIHMDEKVTDRPSFATASHCLESTTGRQQDSALAAATDADDISVNRVNDSSFQSQSAAAASDRSESSCAFHNEGVNPVKTEPDTEDSDDDVMIMEPDVKSLMSSSIPLPVVEEMNECEDSDANCVPFSSVSRKRRAVDSGMLLGGLPASVLAASDDQLGDARHWSCNASYAPNNSNICIPQSVFSSGDTDISPHAGTCDFSSHMGFLSTSGSRALLPVCMIFTITRH